MSPWVVTVLVALAAAERLVRADIVRRLLGTSFGRSLTIHDVGAAASKGVPLGGPLGTALRWSIARDADVPTTAFTSMLVSYGVATTFMTWLLPMAVVIADLTQRPATGADVAILAVCTVVIGGSVVFWVVVLSSERVARWVVDLSRRICRRASRRIAVLATVDPGAAVLEIKTSLRAVAVRPVRLFVGTAIAQLIGAVVLLVALRGLGVGAELGVIELARVYFVVSLLSSFVPVPGGVGVVEAGLTGALVAAGVAAPVALAGVLVYRLLTFVAPIVFGGVLYGAWRLDVAHRRVDAELESSTPSVVRADNRGLTRVVVGGHPVAGGIGLCDAVGIE